jgi:hypothetical protein
MLALISAAAVEAPAVAEKLRALVEGYDYQSLLALVGSETLPA